jgi:hypothetical protein
MGRRRREVEEGPGGVIFFASVVGEPMFCIMEAGTRCKMTDASLVLHCLIEVSLSS